MTIEANNSDWKTEEVPVGQIDSILNYGASGEDLSPLSPSSTHSRSQVQIDAAASLVENSTTKPPNSAHTPKTSPRSATEARTGHSSPSSTRATNSSNLATIMKDFGRQSKAQNGNREVVERESKTDIHNPLNPAEKLQPHVQPTKAPSKLNPKAARYHFKASRMTQSSINSLPNLNTASLNTGNGLQRPTQQKNRSNQFAYGRHPHQLHNFYSLTTQNRDGVYERKTNLEMSQDPSLDEPNVVGGVHTAIKSATRNAVSNSPELSDLLKQYILKKCTLNAHCNSGDFDGTALEGLTRLSFVQSLQAVEHYAASVSERIMKKPAYLMGIIRGQESHWDNSRAAAQLEGGSLQLLHLPKRLLVQIGHCCLQGNCLPSDFTPEVLLSLHSLTVEFAMKAVNAFDTNKRIVAGCRGGVVNRPRFLQRLIENVIQQNPITLANLSNLTTEISTMKKDKQNGTDKQEKDRSDTADSKYSSPKSFLSLLGSANTGSATEQGGSPNDSSNSGSTPSAQLSADEKMKFLQRELTERIERERRLQQELGNLKVQVGYWEKECHRLNSTITHILHNQRR